jgi:hypothetical protein
MKQNTVNLFRVLIVWVALNAYFSTAFAQGAHYSVLTITNPTPGIEDLFGNPVAAMGSNRVLIGAIYDNTLGHRTGAAYLFDTHGSLLTTFTNPTPSYEDYFGSSVAAVGSEQVLIGAWGDKEVTFNAGAAYLFSASGELLTTFNKPTPVYADSFGIAVAAIGVDKVLIGANADDTGAIDAGAAYLFSTNGALVMTFTNPTPAIGGFGRPLAALGTDRLLIGSGGPVYLFSTNGTLLMTFTNPVPSAGGYFGWSLAAVGIDRVVITAPGARDTGAAFLFSTNGTLLTMFTNPTPEIDEYFGASVAVAENDRILIGTPNDFSSGFSAGAAYLFNANGVLLTTLYDPTLPTFNVGGFGWSVAAVGSDQFLVGAPDEVIGQLYGGAAYLFNIAPTLALGLTTSNTVAVSWPSPSTGWMLQENTNGVSSVNWSNAPGPIQDDGTNKTLIVNPPTGNRFYRLFKP